MTQIPKFDERNDSVDTVKHQNKLAADQQEGASCNGLGMYIKVIFQIYSCCSIN